MKISGSAHDHYSTPTFHLLASYARKFPCLEINVAMDENCNKIPGVGGGWGWRERVGVLVSIESELFGCCAFLKTQDCIL